MKFEHLFKVGRIGKLELKNRIVMPPMVSLLGGLWGEVTNEQMLALLVVADQYRLNPFLNELYAFPDKKGGITPIVGVDGWSRIINDHQSSFAPVQQIDQSSRTPDPCPEKPFSRFR